MVCMKGGETTLPPQWFLYKTGAISLVLGQQFLKSTKLGALRFPLATSILYPVAWAVQEFQRLGIFIIQGKGNAHAVCLVALGYSSKKNPLEERRVRVSTTHISTVLSKWIYSACLWFLEQHHVHSQSKRPRLTTSKRLLPISEFPSCPWNTFYMSRRSPEESG